MPQWLKDSLVYTAKNAVNAALLMSMQLYHDPVDNNFHNWHGFKGVLWQIGAAILSREALVWGPKLIKWSTTNGGNNAQKPN